MWVVKLGGSLMADPALPNWLDLLAKLGGGRVTIVCGGGGLADEVRRTQALWQFNDLAAHNMAVLAMVQTGYQLHAMNPALQLAASKAEIAGVLHKGRAAIWLPFELQRDAPDARTNWDATSDTIALDLAHELNAERLVVIKSCEIDRSQTLAQLGAAGVLDESFQGGARGAAFPIEVMAKHELPRMRSLLLGGTRDLGG
ncbi:aspartate kinase [Ideonella sp.]|uniref:amino acid kinase family protein n=1 Tax=Ideonella sp. TaxID=1929293 RepID=UPI00351BB93A